MNNNLYNKLLQNAYKTCVINNCLGKSEYIILDIFSNATTKSLCGNHFLEYGHQIIVRKIELRRVNKNG